MIVNYAVTLSPRPTFLNPMSSEMKGKPDILLISLYFWKIMLLDKLF